MPTVEYSYQYPFPSSLSGPKSRPSLRLAVSNPNLDEATHFFSGSVRKPREASVALLALGATARSRFYIPPAMMARLVREADPIITSDGNCLRFETFSLCCGVYARLDLSAGSVDGDFHGRGTTNVDFGPELRASLAQIHKNAKLRLDLGSEGLELSADKVKAVERKIQLPLRWFRCLPEVQNYLCQMKKVHELGKQHAQRFIKELPKASSRGELWVVASGPGLRLSQRRGKNAVRGKGLERLRVVDRLAQHIKSLTVFGDPDGQASAWQFELEKMRFTVALSAEPWRGFSGEGRSLSRLRQAKAATVASVRAKLHWGQMLSETELTRSLDSQEAESVRCALAALATQGLVGYDLAENAYFYREMPFDLDAALAVQPRLKNAFKLLERGAVSRVNEKNSEVIAEVQGSGVVYQVRITEDGVHCSCPWFAKEGSDRGPCKHILATQLLIETNNGKT